MMESVLLIAYHYPPENSVGGARPARFARYLPDHGWQCEVVTAAEQVPNGDSLVHVLPDRTRAFWDAEPVAPPPFAQRWLELAFRRFIFPSAIGLGWCLDAVPFAGRVAKRMKLAPKAVVSSFPPLAAHVAGWRIARQLGVPWIADFRDPYATTLSEAAPWLPRQVAAGLESRFFRDAAAVIANTDAMAASFRQRYTEHAGKLSVIWNGFDPEIPFGPLPIPERPRRVLSHVGALYGGRSPVALLQSMERLREQGNREALQCEIVLLGQSGCSAREHDEIARTATQGWVRWEARHIPKQEANRTSQESDGLILLQPQSSIQVPGKLFEYVRIGRPILSLAPRDSAIEFLLDRCGIPHIDLYPDDPPPVLDSKVAAYLRLPTTPSPPSPWFQQNFDARNQAQELASILNRVTATGRL